MISEDGRNPKMKVGFNNLSHPSVVFRVEISCMCKSNVYASFEYDYIKNEEGLNNHKHDYNIFVSLSETFLAERSITDIWQGPKYSSGYHNS